MQTQGDRDTSKLKKQSEGMAACSPVRGKQRTVYNGRPRCAPEVSTRSIEAAAAYRASRRQIDGCGAWNRPGSVRVGITIVRPSNAHVVSCSSRIDHEAAWPAGGRPATWPRATGGRGEVTPGAQRTATCREVASWTCMYWRFVCEKKTACSIWYLSGMGQHHGWRKRALGVVWHIVHA